MKKEVEPREEKAPNPSVTGNHWCVSNVVLELYSTHVVQEIPRHIYTKLVTCQWYPQVPDRINCKLLWQGEPASQSSTRLCPLKTDSSFKTQLARHRKKQSIVNKSQKTQQIARLGFQELGIKEQLDRDHKINMCTTVCTN